MPTQPNKRLHTFENPHAERDYTIEIRVPEFTCLCPKTGQPDFATLYISYVPDRKCVELKSLKLYIWSFRNEGVFHEAVTNTILNDLVTATAPRYLQLRAEFAVRGGLYTTVIVEHRKPGWVPPPSLTLRSDSIDGRGRAPSGTSVGEPREERGQTPSVTNREPQEQPPLSGPEAARTTETKGTPPANKTPSAGTPIIPTARPATPSPVTGSRFRMLPRERRTSTETPSTVNNDESEPEPAAPLIITPAPASEPSDDIYIGIDMGTGGCRMVAINKEGDILAQAAAPIPIPMKNDNQITQDANVWWKAVSAGLINLLKEIPAAKVSTIAVAGTSGTLLLCDKKGTPIIPAMMYNDNRATDQADAIVEIADANSGAQGATSSLAKLLWLHEKGIDKRAAHALHQADWILGKFTGMWGHSDYNNCLKLGYDGEKLRWPSFIKKLGLSDTLFPTVHAPGAPVGPISAETAKTFGLSPKTRVVAGTTDGVAAFLAAGPSQVGDGVTSLGSTLVLKLLSNKPLFSVEHGVYSHRLGQRWLAGGASNSGGTTLLQYFKLEQMRELTPMLEPDNPTGLDYYPLPDVGERFPINDPHMVPKLEPLPGNSVTFFQGMLEGITNIEAQGYRLLHKLGGPALREIRTTGGGSHNPGWRRIRERILGVPLKNPQSEMAAYGAALLASGQVEKSA